ncbi:hypothetical protein D1007_52407 [Hordeum vulgare]|nr:hypothetical protein D1007_52407 [Hordeum vulgare]
MVGPHRKMSASDPAAKAPLKIARNLISTFLANPPEAPTHAQLHRGRGRVKGGRGGKGKTNTVRPSSPPPVVAPPEKAAHHEDPEPNLFIGYALSHKASFRKATPYDLSDTSSAYTSQTAYNRLTKVREVATKLRGPNYDVASEPLDHELVMIAGEGNKHGKEAIPGDMFPRSTTRTLAEHKALLGLPKPFVCERVTPARAEMECLLEEKLIVERRRAAVERAAERAEDRRLTAEDRAMERAEERRLADERT